MIKRCRNKKDQVYKYYGARGIKVCKEWERNAKVFIDWSLENKYKEGFQIDRIDNNGNYEPSNCRYTTRSENSINTRKRIDNKSGYSGVHFDKNRNKWMSYIEINRKRHNLGRVDSKREAIELRNKWIIDNKTSHKIQEVI